jgi:hypothetical protein
MEERTMSEGPLLMDWRPKRGRRNYPPRNMMNELEWGIARKVDWLRREEEAKQQAMFRHTLKVIVFTFVAAFVLGWLYRARFSGF